MKTRFVGHVIDQLKTMDCRHTRRYKTYTGAHDAAKKLCKRTMGGRGIIEVEEIEEES